MTDVTQYINNIDPTFPAPGKDNNSQGFRSNFSNIQQALSSLNQNINSIAATTVNVNSPKVTATQSMTSLGPLYFGTQTFAYVTAVDNKLTVAGVNSAGAPAAGEVAFSPSIVTISTNPNTVDTDNIGTYFITSSPTIGLLVGGVFYCPSTGTGPFKITNIVGNKIYFTGSGGLDPSVDVTNPVFNKNTVLTTSTVIPFFGQGFPGSIIVASTKNSLATTSGSLVVQGGAGVAKNLNVGGNTTISGNLTITGDVTFGSTSGLNGSYSNVNAGATSTGYQKLPGGLIMAWGYVPNISSRGTIQICLPTIAGSGANGFPNGTLSVHATARVTNSFVTYYAPVYSSYTTYNGSHDQIQSVASYISGRNLTTATIAGGTSVSNVTARNFQYSYYQNVVCYPCTQLCGTNPYDGGQGYAFTTKYLNTASVYWSAIGY
jgi:hypothetical protein